MKRFLLAVAMPALTLCACTDMGTSYMSVPSNQAGSGERYNAYQENPFVQTAQTPTSTFSIDADGGSYANVRRFIEGGSLPPRDAVRTEEFLNYFRYDYADPADEQPIAVNGEIGVCPWDTTHRMIQIGIKGKNPGVIRPPSNIVLLIDVSGSMSSGDKLPLLKQGFGMLIDQFSQADRIAIVTYAGSAGVALESTSGDQKPKIREVISRLGAGGSTAGSQGITTAYDIALKNLIPGGNNRVILATDGDFNVGPSSTKELVDLITQKRESGVYLSVIGVGAGNYNEAMMEQLADRGNGIYEYIDNLEQARKVFVQEFSKFYTVAKDVKIQVQFNPVMVSSYRLIGYENRKLDSADFTNDRKDAGEISAGQTVAALYEIVPNDYSAIDGTPYFTIDFRYKNLTDPDSRQITLSIADRATTFEAGSENLRFASAVAAFAQLLRGSAYTGSATCDDVIKWANAARGFDPDNLRSEFVGVVRKAGSLR